MGEDVGVYRQFNDVNIPKMNTIFHAILLHPLANDCNRSRPPPPAYNRFQPPTCDYRKYPPRSACMRRASAPATASIRPCPPPSTLFDPRPGPQEPPVYLLLVLPILHPTFRLSYLGCSGCDAVSMPRDDARMVGPGQCALDASEALDASMSRVRERIEENVPACA